jgi:hypothetical protein
MPAPSGILRLALPAAVALCSVASAPAPTPPPLAGPKVGVPAPRATLVELDLQGRVRIPEEPPEEAALALLGLDRPDAPRAQREAHARAREILARRARILDEFVVGNIPLLNMLNTSRDERERFLLILEAGRRLAPLTRDGTLREQIARCLPDEDRVRFGALLDEFWSAVVRERRTVRRPDGKRPGRIEILAQVRLESLGREIERAFRRIVESGELLYRSATRGLTLTPAQRRELREISAVFARLGDGGREDEKRRLFTRALLVLDVEQRPKFIRNLKGL